MARYDAHVQLAPTMHEGHMKHYWHISMTTKDGNFTVKHGYQKDVRDAFFEASTAAFYLIKNLK